MIVKRCSWLVGLLCLAAHAVLADDGAVAVQATAATSEFVALIDAARTKFQPVTADDVAQAKATVRERLLEVGQAIRVGPQWTNYLMWEKQIEALDRDEPGDTELWRLLYARVARDTTPLDWDVFHRYRAALQRLIRKIAAHHNPELEAEYGAVLTELETLLARSGKHWPAADAARVSELLTKLNRQQQAPELIAAVRQLATAPNLVVEIPAAMIAGSQHFEEDYTFRRLIRGTQVNGSGTLNADQTFALGASEDSIVVRSVVKGTSDSTSAGYGDGVTVRSSGSLRFESTSNLSVDMEGIKSSGFVTTGRLSTSILGISTNYRSRAAARARQAVYNRQESDRRAAQSQALTDLDATFETRLDEMISPLQTAYREHAYLPLTRHDRLPQKAAFASSEDRATLKCWFADEAQLAAPSDPPWSERTTEHIRIAVHESAVNNTSALLKGRLRSLVSVLNGKVFEYIAESAASSERIDIRFDDEVAIRESFRDDTLELRLVGTEFVIDGSTYPGMEIIMRYRIESEPTIVFRLSEPPQVAAYTPPGGPRRRLGLRGIALRRILSNVLAENVFDTLDFAEIVLPEPLDQLGTFQTRRVGIKDGWLGIEAVPLATPVTETAEANGNALTEPAAD